MSSITFTGIASGLDTASIVTAMLGNYQTKYDNALRQEMLLELKLEKYQEVSAKVVNFFDTQIREMRMESTYLSTITSVSNSDVLEIIGGGSDGDYIQIESLAVPATISTEAITQSPLEGSDTLSSAGISSGTITVNGTEIELNEDDTIDELVQKFKDAGVDASFNSNGEIQLSASEGSPLILGGDLSNLGINTSDAAETEVLTAVLDEDGNPTYDEDGNAITEVAGYLYTFTEDITSDELEKVGLSSSTTLAELGITELSQLEVNGEAINLSPDATIQDLIDNLQSKGINAKFDESVGAFQISSNEGDIVLGGDGVAELSKLGISTDNLVQSVDEDGNTTYTAECQEAVAYYNGMKVTSNTNTFTLDDVSFTAKDIGSVTVSQTQDVDAVVDRITSFVDAYNELISELNTLLGADYNSEYEPLLDEEKEGMTDAEIELWNEKVSESLLRNDPILQSLVTGMRNSLNSLYSGAEPNSLLAIGISTSTDYTEQGKLYIDEDTLRDALSTNLEGVMDLFTGNSEKGIEGIMESLYTQVNDALKSGTDKTYNSLFYDGALERLISLQSDKVDSALSTMETMEEIYNAKFLAMELAIQKMNSQASLFTTTY